MAKRTVRDLEVKGKKVLVRVDFNVPHKGDVITDDNRIVAALPTIKYLLEHEAKVILFSHLGKVDHKDPEKCASDKKKNNMNIVAARLQEYLPDSKVTFVDATRGAELEAAVAELKEGDVVVMQNTRYEKGESKNDPELSAYWASLADLYVSDAFGSVHRAHSSTVGVAQHLPSAVGFLIEKELKFLGDAVEHPVRPFVGILGGAKVADKLKVIDNLLEKCDTLIIGGGMAYTFLKAKGMEVGQSLVDLEKVEYCGEMIAKAERLGKKLLLPVDTVVADHFPDPIDGEIETKVVASDAIPADMQGLDIGPKTAELFAKEVKAAKTVVWNGPMGVFENPILAKGTNAVAAALAEADGTTIIGGGDSAAAIKQLGYADKVSHVSTGGGASLEFLEGNGLPGVDAIDELGRKPIIVGNWKMNKTIAEAQEFIAAIDPIVHDHATFGVATSFIALQSSVAAAKNLIVAAENCHFKDSGAFTGEVSVPMLQEVGAKWCIIGHSERRQMFGDTNETVNLKAKRLVAAGITPILCVGESLEQFEAGETEAWVRTQVKECLAGLSPKAVEDLVIAYEPIWAIGTGKNATKEIAEATCAIVRDEVCKNFGKLVADKVRVQYGGSVKPENIADYMAEPDIDGALIGGASLKVDSFTAIIEAVK